MPAGLLAGEAGRLPPTRRLLVVRLTARAGVAGREAAPWGGSLFLGTRLGSSRVLVRGFTADRSSLRPMEMRWDRRLRNGLAAPEP